MLRYNYDGTVSDITINGMINGKVTSSLVTAPTINTSGSTGLTTASNFTYQLQTTLSNSSSLGTAFYQTLVSSSGIRIENFEFNNRYTIMIPADTTLNQIIDDRILVDEDLSHIADASLSPNVKTISAKQFGTTYSNGTVWVIGDDSKLVDVNLGNGFGVVGQQQNNRGWIKFGTNGPLWGHNGNQSTLPTPGDGLYAITGSLMVSSSKLMFYNGSSTGTNGWTAIK